MCAFRLNTIMSSDETLGAEAYQKQRDRIEMEERFGPKAPVHENLRNFRTSKKLKKKQIAEYMEVTTRTYYTYEKGTRPIPSDALVKLATMTRADLNEILMGRAASIEADVMRAGLEDLRIIEELLKTEYPKVTENDYHKIALRVVCTDWGHLPRMHPAVIRQAISQTTRYRDEPLSLPAPPRFEDFDKNENRYEKAVKDWQRLVDDNFGRH